MREKQNQQEKDRRIGRPSIKGKPFRINESNRKEYVSG